jgi:hypothetical protein
LYNSLNAASEIPLKKLLYICESAPEYDDNLYVKLHTAVISYQLIARILFVGNTVEMYGTEFPKENSTYVG